MKPPLISCIVPVFNGERYLREALDSIRAQTYRRLEIIVADDGSTDGTAAVVAGFGEHVRYLTQPNAGPAAARNLGLRAAQGDFVAFLDADDLWHPEKLARQMARFQARLDLDLCVTHVQNFWVAELAGEASGYRGHPRLAPAIPGYVCQALLTRRTLFDMVGAFNTGLPAGEDTDWFLHAAEHGAVMEILPEVLVYRRLHQTNISWGLTRVNSRERDVLLQVLKASLDRRRPRRDGSVAAPYQFPGSGWQQKR
jgi:glycosyltransferase involved in cell wall biosynthesis